MLELLFLGRCAVAVQIQEFAAQQAAAFGASRQSRGDVGKAAHIRHHLDPGAVGHVAGGAGLRQTGLRAGITGIAEATALGQFGLGRVHADQPALAFKDDGLAIGDAQSLGPGGHHHRHPTRGGQNGDMRRRARAGQTDPRQPAVIQRGELRGQQVLGKDHRGLVQRDMVLGQPREQPHDAALYILQVAGAFGHDRVAKRAQGSDLAVQRDLPAPGSAFTLGDQGEGFVAQRAVVQERQMRLEDVGLCAVLSLNIGADRGAGLIQRAVQRGGLGRCIGAGLGHGQFALMQAQRAADGDAGHRRRAGKRQNRAGRMRRQHGLHGRCGRCRGRGLRGGARSMGFDKGHDGIDGGLCLGTGKDGQSVAMFGAQRHQRNRAAGIDGLAVQGDLHRHRRGFRMLCDHTCGAGVQAKGIGQHRLARQAGSSRSLGRGSGRAACRGQRQHRIAGLHRARNGTALQGEIIAIGQDHRDHHRRHLRRHPRPVKTDQRLALTHGIAVADLRLKALSVQAHGVDADMHQHLGAVAGAQGDGVTRIVQADDAAVEGGTEQPLGRVDGKAVAQNAFGKDRVGHIGQIDQPSGDGGGQRDRTRQRAQIHRRGGGAFVGHGLIGLGLAKQLGKQLHFVTSSTLAVAGRPVSTLTCSPSQAERIGQKDSAATRAPACETSAMPCASAPG